MTVPIAEQGLLIPKELLGGAKEVVILQEPGRITVFLDPANDPIWRLGKNPIIVKEGGGSENLNKN